MGTTVKPEKRFIFLGGIPVFDYLINVEMEEIFRATGRQVIIIDKKILLPVGTIFKCMVKDLPRPIYINPLANVEVQNFNDELYYAMELGGKHPEQHESLLCTEDLSRVVADLKRMFPDLIHGTEDLKIVTVESQSEIKLGGNNRNIIEAIKTLYESPELAGKTRAITFEHLFFFDVKNRKFKIVKEFYHNLNIDIGDITELHVDNLIPRTSYVLTISTDDQVLDRIVLSNRTNEEIIPPKRLTDRYFKLEYKLRKDRHYISTHLVINSLTNHEELRLITRILRTAYASETTTYLCPTGTFFKCIDTLIDSRYYTTEKEKFFTSRKEFLFTSIIPFIQYLILNTDELAILDKVAEKKGIDFTASMIARRMNQGQKGENTKGGRMLLTSGNKGARFTERLTPERARLYWKKANMPENKLFRFRFADRRILCGDDHIIDLLSTLGAGDTFSGIFIGLKAIRWDAGHAMRGATLGAQHFIQTRKRPKIQDIIATDESHIRSGTATYLRDIISHHISESGDPTRYGTITDTIITIDTSQIQHPFREVLALAETVASSKKNTVTSLPL
ncbi:MAG: hypothetical protein JXO49_02200 [Deltaproteobacteria bacterium]|nr:hypothetical protein [Candidatus Anaeroferrophillus wilburensis]MBN2888140.1 hypothetical protein [Deltaproteobacteria bacterium]